MSKDRNNNDIGIDKYNDKKIDSANGVTPLVSRKTLARIKWFAIISFVGVLIMCVFGKFESFLQNIQTWVNTLAIVFASYVGGAYVIDIPQKDSEETGNHYYTEAYRSRSLIKVIKNYNGQYDEKQHGIAAECVVDMIQNEDQKYWKLVFYLQESDINFLRVWNDFNFYFKRSKKRAWNYEYFDMVRRYVYMKVYQKNKSILCRDTHGKTDVSVL